VLIIKHTDSFFRLSVAVTICQVSSGLNSAAVVARAWQS